MNLLLSTEERVADTLILVQGEDYRILFTSNLLLCEKVRIDYLGNKGWVECDSEWAVEKYLTDLARSIAKEAKEKKTRDQKELEELVERAVLHSMPYYEARKKTKEQLLEFLATAPAPDSAIAVDPEVPF